MARRRARRRPRYSSQERANASGQDFAEARAMNRVLWPATLGYAMETMLHPVFGADAVDVDALVLYALRRRARLPAVRSAIGEQPYGILPAMRPVAMEAWE